MRSIQLSSVDSNYRILQELEDAFPQGTLQGRTFSVHHAGDEFTYTTVEYFKNVHVVLFEGKTGQETEVVVAPSPIKSFIVRAILESNLVYKDIEHSVGDGKENGLSLFNTSRPEKLIFPANSWVKYVTVYVTVDAWMEFTEGKWTELNTIILNENPWILFEMMTPQYANIIKDLFVFNGLQEGKKALILSRSLELITLFLMQLTKRNKDQESMGIPDVEVEQLMRIRSHLQENINHPPNMDILSEKFGMSATKLRSNFKKVFGLPPYQYVLRERLQEAYRLINYTERSLSDIAYSLGFSDQSHFNKSFKAVFDCSPNSLR